MKLALLLQKPPVLSAPPHSSVAQKTAKSPWHQGVCLDSCKDATRRGGGKIKIKFPAQGPFVLPEASSLRDRFFRSISEPSGDSAIRLDHPHPPGGGQCGSWSPPVSSLFLASPHNTPPPPPPSPGVARRSCLERIAKPGANWLLPRCAPALAVRGEEQPLTEPAQLYAPRAGSAEQRRQQRR